MGVSLPYAIGAKLANPDKCVISIDGDSSFMMTFGDLKTVKEHNIPIKIIICNNGCQDMVRVWESLFFDNRITATTNNCNPSFDNETADSNSVIDLYDGMWLRNFMIPNEECTPTTGAGSIGECGGDARPLEFIERVLGEEAIGFTNASVMYFGTYFPTYGRDISMEGLDYFEDYDVNGNGQWEMGNVSGKYNVMSRNAT